MFTVYEWDQRTPRLPWGLDHGMWLRDVQAVHESGRPIEQPRISTGILSPLIYRPVVLRRHFARRFLPVLLVVWATPALSLVLVDVCALSTTALAPTQWYMLHLLSCPA